MKVYEQWGLGLLLFYAVVTICGINDPYYLSGWMLLVFLLLNIKRGALLLSGVDKWVVVLWVYDLISLFTTINENASLVKMIPITLSVFYYFALRIGFQSPIVLNRIFFSLSILGGILSWIGVFTFVYFASSIYKFGWNNLYEFRFLYRPIGFMLNVWGTLLIVFFIITCIAFIFYYKNKNRIFVLMSCLCPIIFGLITTFSRGVYIVFFILIALCICILLVSEIQRHMKIGIIVGSLGCVIFSVFLYPREIQNTLKMVETVSQKRSLEGRLERTLAISKQMNSIPLTGVGVGNYTLVTNAVCYENDLVEYTNYAPNIFVQLIAEKGIIGFFLWFSFSVYLIYIILKCRYPLWSLGIVGCFFALTVREATFPVFLDTPGVMVLVFTILAFSQNVILQNRSDLGMSFSKYRFVLIGCLSVYLILYLNLLFYYKDEKYNFAAIAAVKNEKYDEAIELMEKTSMKTPYLINRAAIYFLEKEWQKSEEYTLAAIEKNPLDVQLRYNLARIYQKMGKIDSAQEILKNLTQLYPNNALYQWGMFDLYYVQNKIEEAISCLVHAIKLSPRILDFMHCQMFLKNNDSIVSPVYKQLKEEMRNMPDEPILLANYAKISLALQDTVQAEIIYRKLTKELPNLIYPWYYQGLIEWKRGNTLEAEKYFKRFMCLVYGPFFSVEKMNEYIKTSVIFEKVNERSCFSTKYSNKFYIWYQSSPVLNTM